MLLGDSEDTWREHIERMEEGKYRKVAVHYHDVRRMELCRPRMDGNDAGTGEMPKP